MDIEAKTTTDKSAGGRALALVCAPMLSVVAGIAALALVVVPAQADDRKWGGHTAHVSGQ